MKKHLFSLSVFLLVFISKAQTQPGGMLLKDFGKALGLPDEFSAQIEIVVGNTAENSMLMQSRIYVGEPGMRYEMDMPGGFGTMTTLALNKGDKTKVYMLNPQQKTYSELPGTSRQISEEDEYKIDDLGEEAVNGIACQKKNLTDPKGKVVIVWLKKNENIPIKCQLEEKGTQINIFFKNFQAGSVNSKLLKIPSSYKKGSAMGGFLNFSQ
jgi:hypothetical protein